MDEKRWFGVQSWVGNLLFFWDIWCLAFAISQGFFALCSLSKVNSICWVGWLYTHLIHVLTDKKVESLKLPHLLSLYFILFLNLTIWLSFTDLI